MLKKWFSCRDVACRVSTVCHFIVSICCRRCCKDLACRVCTGFNYIVVIVIVLFVFVLAHNWRIFGARRDVACHVSTETDPIFTDPVRFANVRN